MIYYEFSFISVLCKGIWVNAVNEYSGCIMGHYSGTWHLHLMQSFCWAYCFPHTLPFLSRLKRKPLRGFLKKILILSLLQWGRRVRPRTLSVATASASPRDGTVMENLTAKTVRTRAQTCVVSQIVVNIVFIVIGLHKNDSEQSSKRFILVALTASLIGVYLSMCPGNHSTNSKSRSCSTAWFTSVSGWSRERERMSQEEMWPEIISESLCLSAKLYLPWVILICCTSKCVTLQMSLHPNSAAVSFMVTAAGSVNVSGQVTSQFSLQLQCVVLLDLATKHSINPCRELAEKYEQLF